jgi:hypothetical protein
MLAQAFAPGALSAQHTPLQVTHPRLQAALERLGAGSPTAARTLRALAEGGLPVAIGTPVELAAMLEREGGAAVQEREALLAQLSDGAGAAPAVAWIAFRVAPDAAGLDRVERAWVVVEVDLIARWIHETGDQEAEARIEADLLAILAHELIAHVGSVATTRRLEDFCDDPVPGARSIAGDPGCSLRMENRIRRELNRGLRLRGAAQLPERRSYALDVMNFARAQRRMAGR